MSTQAINDYLEKQLFIERDVVCVLFPCFLPLPLAKLDSRSHTAPSAENSRFMSTPRRSKCRRDINSCRVVPLTCVFSELELYQKHAMSQDDRPPPAATYLITGEKIPKRSRVGDGYYMAVDEEYGGEESQDMGSDTDEDEAVPEVSVILVSESELKGVELFYLLW